MFIYIYMYIHIYIYIYIYVYMSIYISHQRAISPRTKHATIEKAPASFQIALRNIISDVSTCTSTHLQRC